MHPSPSQADPNREARLLRWRLRRQVRTLEKQRPDRFLTLSERLGEAFPAILARLAGADPALTAECQTLIDLIEKAALRIQNDSGRDIIRLEIDRKIREFLAKKEEP